MDPVTDTGGGPAAPDGVPGPMRVAVVGASSGLGRCVAVGLAHRGARVALLARRRRLLEEAAAEAGGDAVPVTCDVTDPASCRAAVEAAATHLGGLDAVVYGAGVGVLRPIEDLDRDVWERVFATNVIGASEVTRAALPHLVASGGTAAFLTSVSASLTSPWPGLASYTVSKAALDKLVEAWRSEHPAVGFTRVVVGECLGGEGDSATQLAAAWDPGLADRMFALWADRGLIADELMDVAHLIETVDTVLRLGATATVPIVAVTPRRAL